MIVPLGTDRDGRRPPRATVLLIALNVAVYIAMMTGAAAFWTDRDLVDQLRAVVSVDHRVSDLDLYRQIFVSQMWAEPGVTPWWSLFTAMFTHDPNSILHIAGNMIFLWAFGKSIESHLGFWRFLILYLAGGMAAWGVHALLGGGPAIGASGATSSVACLFLAFFPRSHTRVLYLIGMSLHYVSSAWLIGLYFTIDVVRASLDSAGIMPSDVASGAHIGGSLFGLGAGLFLLRMGWAPRGEWDLLHLTRQFFRRRAMRAALQPTGPTPWMSGKARGPIAAGGPLTGTTAEEALLRAAITTALRAGDDAKTTLAYGALLAKFPSATLAPDLQLDVANRAMRSDALPLAMQGYASFLASAPGHSKGPEVRLLLAAIYIRRLGQPAAATPLLVGLRERLQDPAQIALVESLMAECPGVAPPPIPPQPPQQSPGGTSHGASERRS